MIRSFNISAFFKCCTEVCEFAGEYSPENGGLYVCCNTIPLFTFGVDLYTYDQIRAMIFYLAGFGSANRCGKNTISIVLDYPVGAEDLYYDKLAFTFFDEVNITKAVDADVIKPCVMEVSGSGYKYLCPPLPVMHWDDSVSGLLDQLDKLDALVNSNLETAFKNAITKYK